jgi:hypothetical protein
MSHTGKYSVRISCNGYGALKFVCEEELHPTSNRNAEKREIKRYVRLPVCLHICCLSGLCQCLRPYRADACCWNYNAKDFKLDHQIVDDLNLMSSLRRRYLKEKRRRDASNIF